ncbi:MAG TPA: SDR family NAD(P)-dependent oxidoreductase [Gemmataceae bacterium]|nr:SDR family NAD(P)-dependent oxidoreductase [Gemmataceae bacterium]
MSTFANRVVLITGAGSGIGRQMALDVAAEGAAVAALDIKPDGLESLAAELKGKPVAIAVGDVTDRESLYPAVHALERAVGPTDVLIANAGIGCENGADPYNAEGFEAQVRVNLIGVSNSVGAVLPGMLERGHGHLVAIASLASYRGLPKMAGYCASKSGVVALMEALRVELVPRGVAVTTVCPGWIRTPLTENLDVPHPFLMDPREAVRRILGAVRERRAFFAFPGTTARRVRLLRWLPAGASDWLVRKMMATYARKDDEAK